MIYASINGSEFQDALQKDWKFSQEDYLALKLKLMASFIALNSLKITSE